MEQIVRITAEPQADPDKCRFTLEKPILDGGSFVFNSKKEAVDSSLAEAIFDIKNIVSVFMGANFILVTKKGADDWRTVAPEVGSAIRMALASGKPLVSEEVKKKLPNEDEIRRQVKKVLDEQINPAVSSHGGHIELLDVRKNDIFIKMAGGCQGCGMAGATLKQGVEQTLRREIPRLGAVYDTTDHASGTNPYYAPGI